MNINIKTPVSAVNSNVKKKAKPVLNKAILNSTNSTAYNKFIKKDAYENNNLQFKIKQIKFFKEDEEKMANMSLNDKIAYKIKLKSENKYTIA